MASFDAPSREFCAMRRLPSNTPLQVLMTLNDATFVEAAQALAHRMQQAGDDLPEQLRFGFLLATCRKATDAEINELRQLHNRCLPDGEQRALESVAAILLNLDEVLTK